jgi:PHD/YefM family antitoxin component YafN of YafNO toxin-antitoxin module
MNIADHIYEHVKIMPDTIASEVLNFIECLELKQQLTVFQNQNEGVNHLSLTGADEDNGLLETLYLTHSPANAEWLWKGIEQYRRGEVQEIDVASYLD